MVARAMDGGTAVCNKTCVKSGWMDAWLGQLASYSCRSGRMILFYFLDDDGLGGDVSFSLVVGRRVRTI